MSGGVLVGPSGLQVANEEQAINDAIRRVSAKKALELDAGCVFTLAFLAFSKGWAR